MKKRFKLVSFLVVIIVGALTSAKRPFLFVASATYVEDPITQDTVWTLTDSPFVLSKDIIVYPDATLTIEPGVEVRFGGNFSLIVEGSVSVGGVEKNPIIFTSNKEQPGLEDWNTIKFKGTKPSLLSYCVLQHAKDAITIKTGNLKIENCRVVNNSRNGIKIENGIAEVKGNTIANNFENGIYVTGENQVTIQNNTIRSNAKGILLTGNSTVGVSITQNIIMSNTHSGIQLDAGEYGNIDTVNNVLSANNKGFYISGNASTYITKNSISYNNIGLFYEGGRSHVAYYNDIYCNECGMDVSCNATVNAEYNYWGHESGPYHVSLNPAGEGNPVGGDGVHLDFIFFLTAPISHINMRPMASLLTDKSLVPPYQAVTFIATTSSDDGRVDKYFFDFGDGDCSGWTTLSIFAHKYPAVGTYHASVTVIDDFGVTSSNVAMVTIDVTDLIPLQVSLATSNYTVDYGKQVPLTVHVRSGTNPIESAKITMLSIIGGSFSNSSGWTDSTGCFITTFTAPNVTRTTDVRIIATASKIGHADGSDYRYLEIQPPLLVELTEPTSFESEETTTVTAHITYNGQPVAEALVLVSADSGTFSADSKFTNSDGNAEFNFTAPQTLIQQHITITATGSKIGYLEGFCRVPITVTPKMLVVEVTANPAMLVSEKSSNLTVHVTHNTRPVPNTTVTVSSDGGGIFSAETGTTDTNGDAVFTFLAPPADMPLEITVAANAAKTGYVGGEHYVGIIVYPGMLNVEVTASRAIVKSGATSVVIVRVTCNATVVANANVEMLSDYGNFSVNTGITDSDGYCMFDFIAPQVTEELSVTITANAAKNGYRSGQDRTIINVTPESLMIDIIADPPVVRSEETAHVTVHVTYKGQLVAGALITIWSDGGGNFSATTGTTDSSGDCTFVFTASQTTTQLNISITATATKAGYADGQGQTRIVIEPKMLIVEAAAEPTTLISEAVSQVTVHVAYEGMPIPNATVTISSDKGGNFSAETGTTNMSGNVMFTFIAPKVITQLNFTVTARATKTSYADGEGLVEITVNPGTLDVQVSASPIVVEARAVSTVTVHVTCNANSVAGAIVTVSADGGGNFSATTGTTDSSGDCTFFFTAPQTPSQLNITLTATATKTGYIDGESQTKLTVNPEVIPEPGGAGLPLIAILIMAVLIVVIAIVALLIKLKIISISWREE